MPAPLRPSSGHRYVILQAWQYRLMRAIKRRPPGTKVLVYKDMASTRDDAHRADVLPTGVGYRYASRHHHQRRDALPLAAMDRLSLRGLQGVVDEGAPRPRPGDARR